MKKVSKKEIQLLIINAIDQALFNIGIGLPSKKTKKAIVKTSEKISVGADQDLRKQNKKEAQKVKEEKSKNSKSNKKPRIKE